MTDFNDFKIEKEKIPGFVLEVVETLQKKGFEAYLVGGCVRDLVLGREPKDWDVTTNAIPEQIIASFPHTFYENTFGTVGVVTDQLSAVPESPTKTEGNERVKKEYVVEVTPYREEGAYTDGRRPDTVSFSKNIKDDLKRRDFSMNALAYDPVKGNLVDDFDGLKDIKDKIVRAVGEPLSRFREDGLRVMRAVRFATELGFTINTDTEKALNDSREMLAKIAKERVRDELNKVFMSDIPMAGIFMLQRYGLLEYIIPELEEGLHTKQNQAHSYNVYEHLLRSLQCAADKKYPLDIRIAALLHDIGKPKSRRFSEEKKDFTFYGHEVIGAEMSKKILDRLKYPKASIEKIYKLVRWHMFFSDTEEISLSAVRRMIANVGKENIWDLMNLRICDRVGTGRPKEDPYRLRKYKSMLDQVMMDPVTVGMLKINGNTLINKLHVNPGPQIGLILNALLEEVLDNPDKNTEELLMKRAVELNGTELRVLRELADKGKKAKEAKEQEQIKDINRKYSVN